MAHPLFTAIDDLSQWAGMPVMDPEFWKNEDRDGWHQHWDIIYNLFESLVATVETELLNERETDLLLSVIEHDNESEFLADVASEHPAAFLHLAKAALNSAHDEAKWQLAIRLPLLPDREQALELLERFVNDPDEYVNRRSLLTMAELNGKMTEYYCEKFWQRRIYGEGDQYQRMAVLTCLQAIHSPRLGHYLELARDDGREYLMQRVNEIEEAKRQV